MARRKYTPCCLLYFEGISRGKGTMPKKSARRVVGEFKGAEIVLTDLILKETYGHIVCGKRDDFWLNHEIVAVKIDKETSALFGIHIPYFIVNSLNIDFAKPLPPEVVYARLECFHPVEKGEGSWLVLAWFQKPNQNPFRLLVKYLKEHNWKKLAADFQGE